MKTNDSGLWVVVIVLVLIGVLFVGSGFYLYSRNVIGKLFYLQESLHQANY